MKSEKMNTNNSAETMKRAKPLSKGFYVGSIIAAGITGSILCALGVIQIEEDLGPLVFSLGLLLIVYAGIVWLILLHKLWTTIEGEQARTTAGKAVGFLFIPFYNYYWIFQAILGWAQDFNRFTTKNKLSTPRVSEPVALTICILSLVSFIPFVCFLTIVPNIVLIIIFMVQAINAVNATRQELVQTGHPYSSRIQIQKTLTPEARKRRRIAWLGGLIGVPVLLVILAIFIPKISERREFNTFLRHAQEKVEYYRPLLVQLATEIDPNTTPHVSQKLYQTLHSMDRKPVGRVYLYIPYVSEDYRIWKYMSAFPRNAPGEFKGTVVTLYVEKAALSTFRGDPSLIDAFNKQTHYSWNEVLYDSQKRAVAVIRLIRWGFNEDYLNELEERVVDLLTQEH